MKTINRVLHILSYASAVGGVNPECSEGPLVLQQSKALNQLFSQLSQQGIHTQWGAILKSSFPDSSELGAEEVRRLCQALASTTFELTRNKEFFIVLGGDHTSAIGTWSGVREALPGPLGLLWIDAHMDSHTPDTTKSGRFHGMPLSALLGYGNSRFSQLVTDQPKLQPEHVCLIGVRSFEEGEAKLLKQLNVRIFFMDEVKQRGLAVIFKEALAIVTQGTVGYGLSLDVDSLDPREAPGVDVPEPDGLKLQDLSQALQQLAGDPRLLGAEVVEFNPSKDSNQLTEKAIVELIKALGSYHA